MFYSVRFGPENFSLSLQSAHYMSFRALDSDTSSASSKIVFSGAQGGPLLSYLHPFYMTELGNNLQDIQMTNPTTLNPRNMEAQNPLPNRTQNSSSFNPPVPTTRSALPKRTGWSEDFKIYITRLEARTKRKWAPYIDTCSMCLDMIDTLWEGKKTKGGSMVR